jgi:hypothetical protein
MTRRSRKGRALKRRYGRAIHGPQAITRARPDGFYDVILVNDKGFEVGAPLARGVPRSLAKSIIKRRHR